jgi:hypothetical protein
MTELPCRRCGEVTGNRVLIYGKNELGALVAKTAQCRGPCPGGRPQSQRRERVRTLRQPGTRPED